MCKGWKDWLKKTQIKKPQKWSKNNSDHLESKHWRPCKIICDVPTCADKAYALFSLALSHSLFALYPCVSQVTTLLGTLEAWCSTCVAELIDTQTSAIHLLHSPVFLRTCSSTPLFPDLSAVVTITSGSINYMFHLASLCLPYPLVSFSIVFLFVAFLEIL